MARKNIASTRTELWADYRDTIKKDFLRAEKKKVKALPPQKEVVIAEAPRKVTKAEALLHEYEQKKKPEEVRRGPNPLIVILVTILFILIIVGLIYVMKGYYK